MLNWAVTCAIWVVIVFDCWAYMGLAHLLFDNNVNEYNMIRLKMVCIMYGPI